MGHLGSAVLRALGPLVALVARRSVGIDLGRAMLKAVEVGPGAGGLRVHRHLVERLPEGQEREVVIARALEGFLGVRPRHPVSIVLPTRLVGLRTITLPTRSGDQVARMLPFQVKRFCPLPPAEIACAAYLSPVAREAPVPALVAWTRKASIPRIALGAGTRSPDHAQPMPVALYCFARAFGGPLADAELALVDLGHASTGVVVFRGEEIYFARESAVGVRDLVEALARGMAAGPDAAEERLWGLGAIDPLGVEGRLLVPVLDRLAADVRAGFQQAHFTESPRLVRPARVYLVGGGTRLGGLDAYLTGLLEAPVQRLAPTVPGLAPDEAPLLAGAIGAALAPLADHAVSLDLLAAPAPVPTGLGGRDIPIVPTAIIALSLLVSSGGQALWTLREEERAAGREAELRSIWPGKERDPASLKRVVGQMEDARRRFAASGVLAALEEVLRGDPSVGAASGVVCDQLRTEVDGRVGLSATAASYEAIARLLERLDASGLFRGSSLVGTSAAPDGARVRFRVQTAATDRVRP